tara:strand:+ start:19878 stop:20282 length:405 start_codon:yes stop_codon:yes gene_type:complete
MRTTEQNKKLIKRLKESQRIIEDAAQTIADWFEDKESRGQVYQDLIEQKEKNRKLLQKIFNNDVQFLNDLCKIIKYKTVKNIDRGQTIEINKEYEIYSYLEGKQVVLIDRQTDTELFTILLDKANKILIFESLT